MGPPSNRAQAHRNHQNQASPGLPLEYQAYLDQQREMNKQIMETMRQTTNDQINANMKQLVLQQAQSILSRKATEAFKGAADDLLRIQSMGHAERERLMGASEASIDVPEWRSAQEVRDGAPHVNRNSSDLAPISDNTTDEDVANFLDALGQRALAPTNECNTGFVSPNEVNPDNGNQWNELMNISSIRENAAASLEPEEEDLESLASNLESI